MSEIEVKTKAYAKVALEVSLTESWDDRCTLSEVYSQAKDSARSIIQQRIDGRNIKIIGEPKIETVLTER